MREEIEEIKKILRDIIIPPKKEKEEDLKDERKDDI